MKERFIYHCSNCTTEITGKVHVFGNEFYCDEACMNWGVEAQDKDAEALEGELDAVATGPKAVTAD